MAEPMIVITTSDRQELLEQIGRRLVEERLAACCQISSPIKSIYRWDRSVETATEFELKIKTVASHQEAVAVLIQQMHNYDVPQIIAIEVKHLNAAYRDWVDSSLG